MSRPATMGAQEARLWFSGGGTGYHAAVGEACEEFAVPWCGFALETERVFAGGLAGEVMGHVLVIAYVLISGGGGIGEDLASRGKFASGISIY